jgi:hypothetical protein
MAYHYGHTVRKPGLDRQVRIFEVNKTPVNKTISHQHDKVLTGYRGARSQLSILCVGQFRCVASQHDLSRL